jgi:hypothetical protein
MKTTLGVRLKDFINYKKIKNLEFAAAVSATQQEVTNWSNGRGLAVNRLVDILKSYPDLNARWLLTGQGEMINGMQGEIQELVQEPPSTYETRCRLCDEKEKRIAILEKLISLYEAKPQ